MAGSVKVDPDGLQKSKLIAAILDSEQFDAAMVPEADQTTEAPSLCIPVAVARSAGATDDQGCVTDASAGEGLLHLLELHAQPQRAHHIATGELEIPIRAQIGGTLHQCRYATLGVEVAPLREWAGHTGRWRP